MKKAEAYWPLILLLAMVKFLLPVFLQDPLYELQRDEFLYYEQGQHPALGYLENPPLLSWLGTISSRLGGSEAWIKLWPCLFGAATVVLSCLVAAELGGKLFAQFLAGFGIITGAFLRIHYLFQPNILDIFSWTLAAYFLVRYINDRQKKFIYGLCLSLALGWWSKYSIAFMGTALFAGLLLTVHRNIYRDATLYKALFISFLLILPNLWWQYNHNWPLIHHMKELRETQLRYLDKTGFILDQFLMLFPVIWVWTGGLIWLLRRKTWQVLAYTYFIVVLLVLFGSGKNYYTLGAYPMLLAAGGVAWEQWIHQNRWKRYLLSGVIILLTLLFIPILLPVWKPAKLAAFYRQSGVAKTGVLKWEDGRDHALPQDFADMLGWKELAEKTEAFYDSIEKPGDRKTLIYCRNYGQAGSLIFYGRGKNFKRSVISDNGSFILWAKAPDFSNLIFIGRRIPGKDDEVFNHFAKMTIVDSVTHPYSRQHGDKIIFYEQADTTGLRLAREGLREARDRFHR